LSFLGQALNASEKRRITDVVLTHCNRPRSWNWQTSITSDVPEADEHLQVSATEPENLVEAVNALLRKREGRKL
jgi:hypothetical protein